MPHANDNRRFVRASAAPSVEEIRAMSSEDFARFTGQDGAFDLHDRKFRQSATTTSPALKSTFKQIADAIGTHLGLAKVKLQLLENVELIVLNLLAAYRRDNRLCVTLPMNPLWYSSKEPRNPSLTYRSTVKQAYRGLEGLGFAERITRGSPFGGSYSRIRATPALTALIEREAPRVSPDAFRMAVPHDPIVLNGPWQTDDADEQAGEEKEVAILFPETPETERMRAAINKINAVNTPDRIRLPELDEGEQHLLQDALWKPGENGRPSWSPGNVYEWFVETALHRVFNRASFDLGGRFYGANWQLLPKAWRKRLLIDAEGVIELDYGSLHPRLLLHLYEHTEAPEDPYALIDARRELVKRAMMALINMENGTAQPPKWFRLQDAGMRWRELCVRITAGLPQIVPYIGTGVGLKLQRVDSDIAEAVMLHFAEQDIPCLGIHDSFIVGERHRAELEAVMKDAYRSRIGFEAVVKVG